MNHFRIDDNRLTWRGEGETLVVDPWGPDSVRVRAAIKSEIQNADWALLTPVTSDSRIEIHGDIATLRNGAITVIARASAFYDEQTGYEVTRCSLSFHDAEGRLLFKELDAGGSLKLRARDFRAQLGGSHRLTAAFESAPDEKLYGMGQYQQSLLNIKGSTFELAHRNSQASVPFVLSSAGYGFFWHNPAIGRATFSLNRTEWVAEATEQLDYWVTAGSTPAQITAAYANATGHAPMMPEYGLGYWQCKLRYWNQEQLLEVAREHKRRGLPIDVIVADFFHWPKMGDFRFDEEFWPDPAAMVAELKELGIELMVSVWPQISTESENYAELKREGMLVRAERGPDVHMGFQGPSAFLDVTDPRARERLWELVRKNYHDLGVKLFWLDEAEPEYGVYDFDNYRYHAGPNTAVGNIYPQAFSRAFWQGQQEAGQTDVVNLVRCAWAGSQRYGALVWSGDIHSTFEDLRRQITAGVHMGVAGIPWFTTDIGGFHGGNIQDPAFHDLLIRWFQFGAFCPVMRMHGDRAPYTEITAAAGDARCRTGADNEVWSFGPEVERTLTRYIRLREELRPYTRALMADAHENGQPVMRGLFHEFPADAAAWDVADEYMYGPDLLVAPVLEAGATTRSVYLPDGAEWTELATGVVHTGGQRVEAFAAQDVIPVFGRDGAFVELRTLLTPA
ncbi:glycoside hydrolase family 31 protein [Microbacterium hydrocarbonoxydans]|uniref:glycoside hydrolase family 31 protein n=1 Tax=Microbacterium hydrocarbonoxydans TaxID=273678 RepID=UPI003D964738